MVLAIQILHVIVSIFLILVILLQAGKGGGVGAAFGGAGSQTVFGGRGAQTFLGKITAAAAGIFFLTSLTLSYASGTSARSVVEGDVAPAIEAAKPADPAAAAPTPAPAEAPAPAPAGGDTKPADAK